jgi:hypothetical protein
MEVVYAFTNYRKQKKDAERAFLKLESSKLEVL